MCRHRATSVAHPVGTTPTPDSLVQPSRRPHYQQSVSLCFGPVCLGLGIVGSGGEGLSEYPPLTVGDLGTEGWSSTQDCHCEPKERHEKR